MIRWVVVLCALNAAAVRADLAVAPHGDYRIWLLWRMLAMPVALGVLWLAHRAPEDEVTQRLGRAGLLGACGLCLVSIAADLPHLVLPLFS